MIEEEDEDEIEEVEGGAEAEEESSLLLPLGAPPFSCFRPTMAMQWGPGLRR